MVTAQTFPTVARGLGEISPSREEFRELARDRRVIPVTRRLLADARHPRRPCTPPWPGTGPARSCWSRPRTGSPGRAGRSSGSTAPAALTERDGGAVWLGTPPGGLPTGGDPLPVLAETLRAAAHRAAGRPAAADRRHGRLPRLRRRPPAGADRPDTGGPVTTRHPGAGHAAGHRPGRARPPRGHRDADRERGELGRHRRAGGRRLRRRGGPAGRDDRAVGRCRRPPPARSFSRTTPEFTRQRSTEDYRATVEAPKEHIRAGDAFQIVLSQRFDVPTQADPLDIYRVLRTHQPEPVHVPAAAADAGGSDRIVGSSPEALVTVRDGLVTMHPIAGHPAARR